MKTTWASWRRLGLVTGGLFAPGAAAAQKIDLNVPIGSTESVSDFGEYIGVFYAYFVQIVGILAVAMIMWGGYKWITAGGNSTAIQGAKDTIVAAIMGVILTMISYILLYLINPGIVSLTAVIPGITIRDPNISFDAESGRYTATYAIDLCTNIREVSNGREEIRDFKKGQTLGEKKKLNEYINQYAGGDPGLAAFVKGIIEVESGYKTYQQSTCDGVPGPCACGIAQFKPETIIKYNQTCDLGLPAQPVTTDLDETIAWKQTVCDLVKNNPMGSICASAQFNREQFQRYNGDAVSVAAYYNGGDAALKNSVCCKGIKAWQCPIDCEGGEISRNIGFEETRNYVPKVARAVKGVCNQSAKGYDDPILPPLGD